jgi:hypothetical protein
MTVVLNGWMCPVCGFDGLVERPYRPNGSGSYETCSACGFEYGFHDSSEGISHAEYRGSWIAKGMPWRSRGEPPPRWDPATTLFFLKNLPQANPVEVCGARSFLLPGTIAKRAEDYRAITGREFKYQHLTVEAAAEIRTTFTWPYRKPRRGSSRKILKALLPFGLRIYSPEFSLSSIFEGNGGEFPALDERFINWNAFIDIDEIQTDDLLDFITHFWHLGDKIDIFDAIFGWILHADVEGVVEVKILE